MQLLDLLKKLARKTGVLLVVYLVAEFLPSLVRLPATLRIGIPGTRQITLSVDRSLEWIGAIALFLQAGLWINVVVEYWCARYTKHHADDRGGATTIRALAAVARVGLWFILLALVLEGVLGKSVTGLIAGLGVGGIAIAFALQNVLADLFGALSIVLDKPFVIGDSIQVDDFAGNVEHIGLKSTRIRSDTGEQIVFANGELLKGRIRNYGRMNERQAKLITRVAGTATSDQLARIPAIVKKAVESNQQTRFVRSSFSGIGDSTFDFTTVYYMTTAAYQAYADTQQAVLLEIVRRCESEGISLGVQLEGAVRRQTAGLGDSGDASQRRPSQGSDGADRPAPVPQTQPAQPA